MSVRPDGTDGSDHVYREKVAMAYTQLAACRKWGQFYQYTSGIPMLLRTLWYTVVAYIVGLSNNYPAMLILALNLAASVCWKLAKPGSPRESLSTVKIASTLNILSVAMLLINAYKYHAMTDPEIHISHRLCLLLEKEYGIFTGGMIAKMLVRMDVYLDGAAFVLGCLTVANMHPYITIQMNLKMKSDQLAEAAGAAKAAQQARASPAVRKPVEGPARRSRRLA